jgi:hypothetical protein
MQFTTPTQSTPVTMLTIDTTNLEIPRAVFGTLLKGDRLGEIYARLKAMQKQAAPISTETPAKAVSITLEDAISKLATAVLSLTEVIQKKRWPASDKPRTAKDHNRLE